MSSATFDRFTFGKAFKIPWASISPSHGDPVDTSETCNLKASLKTKLTYCITYVLTTIVRLLQRYLAQTVKRPPIRINILIDI